jgi:hypothetical protein
MKEDLLFSSFVLLIVFCFSTANFAQRNSSSTGKASESHQILNFSHLKITNGSIMQCRYVFYYDVTSTMIGRFALDAGCPGGELASWAPPTFASAGVQGGNGIFYILDAGPPPSLCQLDTSNGSVTILGQISGMGGISANGIAYNVVNNSYYICGYSGSTNNLYNIDINTLTATLVSSFGSLGSPMIAIAINSSGIGYGYELMPNNNAYSFNPVTGASALLGPIGFNAQYGQDMDIDIENNIIYLAAFNNNTNCGELRTMDPNTGMTTLLSAFQDQLSVFAIDNGYDIVPVELISFIARVSSGNITLNWSTSTETNNKGFEVEKLFGSEWTGIGFVEGNGTTTEQKSYSFRDENLDAGNYKYRLKQIDFDGTFEYSNIVEADVKTPTEFELSQNYPNPFNPSTVISYQLPVSSNVTLKIYDILGNKISTLVNEEKSAGEYEITFNATGLPSGIYFYKLTSGEYNQSRKMLLIK